MLAVRYRRSGRQPGAGLASWIQLAGQHLLLQVPQLGGGLHAQLPDQDPAGLLVCGQRLSPAAASRQGQHELGVETLPERILRRHRLQLRDELTVTAQMQARIDPPFDRLQPQLLPARHLLTVQQLARDIGKRRSPPQVQRLAQYVGRPLPSPGPHGRAAFLAQPREPQQVQLVIAEPDQVPRIAGDDPRPPTGPSPCRSTLT
jgi:hypothetical protein